MSYFQNIVLQVYYIATDGRAWWTQRRWSCRKVFVPCVKEKNPKYALQVFFVETTYAYDNNTLFLNVLFKSCHLFQSCFRSIPDNPLWSRSSPTYQAFQFATSPTVVPRQRHCRVWQNMVESTKQATQAQELEKTSSKLHHPLTHPLSVYNIFFHYEREHAWSRAMRMITNHTITKRQVEKKSSLSSYVCLKNAKTNDGTWIRRLSITYCQQIESSP